MADPVALYPNLARGSGRSTPLFIVPEQDICAPRSTCETCTWVATGYLQMRLKYVNATCPVHGGVRRIPV